MTIVLFWATVALNVSGVLFAAIYLLINHLQGFDDLAARSASTLKTARISMVLSLLGAFLTSLLSGVEQMQIALDASARLFSIIALSWVAMLMVCGILLLIAVVSKRNFRAGTGAMLGRVVKIAVPGSVIGMLLAWLFS